MLDPVAVTGLLVAAIRAEEHLREGRLFEDPFAAKLAGEAGRAALERYRAASAGPDVPIIEVRTRWYDDRVARAWEAGPRQCVILAAGMDARAYRLAWPAGMRVFEVDRAEVLASKSQALAGSEPRCARIAVGADLRDPWADALVTSGFDRAARTLWLVEGLLQYIPESAVTSIFATIDSLSAPGSIALYDVVGRTMLEAPFMKPTLEMMENHGAPWIFGSDEPGSLVERHGWKASPTEPAIVGNALGRWPFPPIPANVPGAPRGYLVEAVKVEAPAAR
jgi:methyltransferase (TIGR00027 family)